MTHPYFKEYTIVNDPVTIGDLVTLIPASKFFVHVESRCGTYATNPGWGIGTVKSYSEHSAFSVAWEMGANGEELYTSNSCYEGGSCIKKIVKASKVINYKQKQIQIL